MPTRTAARYIQILERAQNENAKQGLRPWVDTGLDQDAFDFMVQVQRIGETVRVRVFLIRGFLRFFGMREPPGKEY